MTENQYAVVKILRSVSGECKSIFDEYRVSFDEKKNVMQVLIDIYADMDRSLSFRRYQCNRGVCGSCTMYINGKLKRACITSMTSEMTIEPVLSYSNVKDLVVDFQKQRHDY